MTSPLVPVPQLPWDYTDADGVRLSIDRGPEGEAVLRAHGLSAAGPAGTTLAVIPGGDVAAVAAALLAAAGSTARVIDLGAELPEMQRDARMGGGWIGPDGFGFADIDPDEALMGDIRRALAVLEARTLDWVRGGGR